MKRFERFSLFLVAVSSALVWLVPKFMSDLEVPEWVTDRFSLCACLPAVLLGSWTFSRYGGYAKTWAMLLSALLMGVGILWTDTSEQGRAMLITAGFLVTLPIASLIRKQRYLRQTLAIFALATAAGMAYAMTLPTLPGRWGELHDRAGNHISNSNVVGTQAAAAIFCALVSLPRRGALNKVILGGSLLVLATASLRTQTRTGILALAGAGLTVVLVRLRHNPSRIFTAAVVTVAVLVCLFVADTTITKGAIYSGIVSRLINDDEATLNSLGDRTGIWNFALSSAMEGTKWLAGVGTGGVDKELGKFFECGGRHQGRDHIWRLYPHNSLVQNGLALGIMGIVLTLVLTYQIIRNAYMLDSVFGNGQRVAFAIFLGLVGTGLVVQREVYWLALGSSLWAMVSTDEIDKRMKPPERHNPCIFSGSESLGLPPLPPSLS